MFAEAWIKSKMFFRKKYFLKMENSNNSFVCLYALNILLSYSPFILIIITRDMLGNRLLFYRFKTLPTTYRDQL